jgi:hypothetical protein
MVVQVVAVVKAGSLSTGATELLIKVFGGTGNANIDTSSPYVAVAGGGAGANGVLEINSKCYSGGAGVAVAISGSSVTYAGGGGGAIRNLRW